MADAVVNGYLADDTKSINFSCDATNVGGIPEGSISGTINNIFTGGPVLEDFTFASATPLLMGVNEMLNLIHIVFENVTITNTTTGQIFTGGTAIVTSYGETETTWEGSITVLFDTHLLTFCGLFTGSTLENGTDICQQPLELVSDLGDWPEDYP